MKLKLNNLLGLYVLAGVIAALAAYYLAIQPALNSASLLSGQTAKVDQKIAALNQLDQDTQKLKSNYSSVKAERDRILHLLPTVSEEERLLVLLSDAAQQTGVTLSTFVPQASTPDFNSSTGIKSVQLYPAAINVTGSFVSIQNFLKKVENAARFVSIDGGDLLGTAAGNAIDARINVTAYYQAAATGTGVKK